MTIGLAVSREGILVRCWVLPGNQHDSQYVDQVQKDLRVVWVMDRGMSSEENQRIMGEKLSGNHLNEIEFFDNNGRILQHTEPTANHRNILNKLKIKSPKRILNVDLTQ